MLSSRYSIRYLLFDILRIPLLYTYERKITAPQRKGVNAQGTVDNPGLISFQKLVGERAAFVFYFLLSETRYCTEVTRWILSSMQFHVVNVSTFSTTTTTTSIYMYTQVGNLGRVQLRWT
jgi:hypothetical protein